MAGQRLMRTERRGERRKIKKRKKEEKDKGEKCWLHQGNISVFRAADLHLRCFCSKIQMNTNSDEAHIEKGQQPAMVLPSSLPSDHQLCSQFIFDWILTKDLNTAELRLNTNYCLITPLALCRPTNTASQNTVLTDKENPELRVKMTGKQGDGRASP